MQTISKITEQVIIVYSQGISKVATKRLDITNPKMFPTFDLDDQMPTSFPSFFTLKSLPKIVSVAGKKASWKNPNIPNDSAITIGLRTGSES